MNIVVTAAVRLRIPAPRARGGHVLPVVTGMMACWLACILRIPHRIGDRLFAMNDAEAEWRGWEVLELRAGLARRYRDPSFDTLGITGTTDDPDDSGWPGEDDSPEPSLADADGG